MESLKLFAFVVAANMAGTLLTVWLFALLRSWEIL